MIGLKKRKEEEREWSRINVGSSFSVGLVIVTESPELMFAWHAINDSVG